VGPAFCPKSYCAAHDLLAGGFDIVQKRNGKARGDALFFNILSIAVSIAVRGMQLTKFAVLDELQS